MPSDESIQKVMRRDRRTHKKFLVTDDTVIIGKSLFESLRFKKNYLGTSNWSGDYFESAGTGAAIVFQQEDAALNLPHYHHSLVDQMKGIFERDWSSAYVHPLKQYFQQCILDRDQEIGKNLTTANFKLPSFCEGEKDLSLLATTSSR